MHLILCLALASFAFSAEASLTPAERTMTLAMAATGKTKARSVRPDGDPASNAERSVAPVVRATAEKAGRKGSAEGVSGVSSGDSQTQSL